MVTDVTAIEMMPVSVLKLSLLRHVNVPKKENIATTTSYFCCSFQPIRMITTRMILKSFSNITIADKKEMYRLKFA